MSDKPFEFGSSQGSFNCPGLCFYMNSDHNVQYLKALFIWIVFLDDGLIEMGTQNQWMLLKNKEKKMQGFNISCLFWK